MLGGALPGVWSVARCGHLCQPFLWQHAPLRAHEHQGQASGAHAFNRLHCSADDSGGSRSSSGGHSGSTGPRLAPYEDRIWTFCNSPLQHEHAMEVSGAQ